MNVGCPNWKSKELEFNKYSWTEGQPLKDIDRVRCVPDLTGDVLIAAAYGFMPYIIFNLDESGNVAEVTGTDIRVLKILSEKLGFDYEILVSNGWYQKMLHEDGSLWYWDGSVGHLYNGTADIALGDLMLMSDPWEVADFIFMYYTHCHYLAGMPGRLAPTYNLLKPFGTYTWIAYCSTLVSTMIIFVIFSYFAHDEEYEGRFDPVTKALMIFMSQFSQAVPSGVKRKKSVNVFLYIWYLYSFIVHASYDCNLRAYVMLAEFEPVVENAEDIINQGRDLFLPGDVPNYALRYSLSPNEFEAKAGEIMLEKGTWYFLGPFGRLSKEFEQEMLEKKHVVTWLGEFVQKAGYQETLRRHGEDPFRLSKATISVFPKEVAFLVRKYSPLTPLFHPHIENLRSSGIIDYITLQYTYDWQPAPVDDDLKPLGLVHLLIGIGIYMGGVALATLAFLFERCHAATNMNPVIRIA